MGGSGWIGVDLDGTLAHWGGDVTRIGAPVRAMLARVQGWLAEEREVRVFTARVAPINGAEFVAEQTQLIQEWCLRHVGTALEVTAIKDFGLLELYDDRACHVEMNTGRLTDHPQVQPDSSWAAGSLFAAHVDGGVFLCMSGHRLLRAGEAIPPGREVLAP
jgi:hypothetical protein